LDASAAFVVALAVYVLTAAPTVLTGDSGEFQFAPYLLGIAHPTGYPLYLLLGWAWSHLLPWGDVAYRMNLFSAVWGALAVGLLVPTLRMALERVDGGIAEQLQRAIALLFALSLAASIGFWSQATAAEVYSLNSFLVILVLYCLLRWARDGTPASKDSIGWLWAAALATGLGLAHHRSIALLAPGAVAFLLMARKRWPPDRQQVLVGLALLVLPLALYLYIPWRAPHTPYLTVELTPGREIHLYDNTFQGLVDFALGRAFQGALDWGGVSAEGLARAWGLQISQFGPVVPVLGLAGLGYLAYRRAWALLALTALSYVALSIFVLVYNIGDIHDLFTPLYIILVLWVAMGAAAVVRLAKLAPGRWGEVLPWAAVLAAVALPLWLVATGFAAVDRSGEVQVRKDWEAVLEQPIPQEAVLISNDRDEMMPLWYLQLIEGRRTDLTGVFPLLTAASEHANVVRLLDEALESGRPVYLVKPMPGLELKYQLIPELDLVRVERTAGASDQGWIPAGEELGGAMALVAYRLGQPEVKSGSGIEVVLHWRPLQLLEDDYTSYVHLVNKSGQPVTQSDHPPGGEHYPSSMWQPGEDLYDAHILDVPLNVATGEYGLEAGMYSQPGIRLLGQKVRLGSVRVDQPDR
jgi:hypothetical protein